MKNSGPSQSPLIFIGHGNPMNVLGPNKYTNYLTELGKTLSQPKAVVCISAHWQTKGTFVTSTASPKMIYDMYGFPDELYKVQYPAKGHPELALFIQSLFKKNSTALSLDNGSWGLDHGSWSVLKHLFPEANIPCLQLSLNVSSSIEDHIKTAQILSQLREQNVLLLGSGNIVHNLRNFSWKEDSPIFPWAAEFDLWFKSKLDSRDYKDLYFNFHDSNCGKLSVPSLDHYLPALYILAASKNTDRLTHLFEEIQNGSIAMRSFMFS